MAIHNNLIASIEAFLFIYGEAIPVKKLAKMLKVSEDAAGQALDALAVALREQGRGLALVRDGESVQLATKPEFHALLGELVKAEVQAELTPAGLETLSIIAYAGPVTRSEVDYIRGVNSSFILRALLIRGIVERSPDPGRPNAYQYRPSFAFLKHIGAAQATELPEYAKFQELMKKVRPPETSFP